MEKMKKVEIVVDRIHLSTIIEIIDNSGASGYTVIPDVQGRGDRGVMSADELTDVFKNSYIFVICPDNIAASLIEAVQTALKQYGGICILSDVLCIHS